MNSGEISNMEGEIISASLEASKQEEKSMVTAGQRKINIIWEVTQALVAVSITLAVIYCAINKIVSQELTNAFFLIVGFYFSRTNHSKTGGVGFKDGSARLWFVIFMLAVII